MPRQTATHLSWKGRRVKISAVDPNEQDRRIREAVTWRAYQLFESHGSSPGHELEDWQHAEADVMRPLGCGLVILDEKISLNTDVSSFDEGPVEVCVEPRRLSICGRPCADKRASVSNSNPGRPRADSIFSVLILPVEVDPSQVVARFNGRVLQIDLYKVPLKLRLDLNVRAA